MNKYDAILADLAAATGPDSELEYRVFAALGRIATRTAENCKWVNPGWTWYDVDGKEFLGIPPTCKDQLSIPVPTNAVSSYGDWYRSLQVTHSVDAAMALVEQTLPIYGVTLSRRMKSQKWGVALTTPDVFGAEAEAPSAPLAILIAMFKTLASGVTAADAA